MKIFIPGGSGLVGTMLARTFHRDGHEVVVLSRSIAPSPLVGEGRSGGAMWRTVPWDGETLGAWAEELDGADVVINLAGRSVNCRYGAANRDAIMQSRVRSTRLVGQAIAAAKRPPRVWLQAGTATIYAHRHDAPNDEFTGLLGGLEPGAPATWRFSTDVAQAWERALDEARTPHTRKVNLRMAMVMSPEPGGAFRVLLRLVRLGLGGTVGSGRQFMSWIHDEDLVRAVYWLIRHEEVEGHVNLAAPHPLPNAEFMRAIRRAWGKWIGLPSPRWLLEFGVWLMRTESELVLKSRCVVPGRLLTGGFEFRFPSWPEAARDLCRRVREGGDPSTSAVAAQAR